jgi:uncharacterized SAM-binding protein YcdF (DUF218 family)
VAFLLISAFTPVPNLLCSWLGSPSELERAEAIVVLGAGAPSDGGLTDASLRRALHGVLLQRKGFAPLLLLLGPPGSRDLTEAEIRARLARELGVPPEAILTVADPRTTWEEALGVGALLRTKGVRRILLVTGTHHMARAQAVFARAGFEVLAAPTDELPSGVSTPEGRLRLMRQVLEELGARFYYWVAGHLG